MTIEQRLEKLERTVRRYQLAFGVLGLALLATTAIACSQQALAAQNNAAIPEVIRARRFEVVARNGRPIVVIKSLKFVDTGREYGSITGLTDGGVQLFGASVNDSGGGLIAVHDGKRRGTKQPPIGVYISANPKIGGHMMFNNGLDKQVVYIGSGKGNSGIFTLGDVNVTVRQALNGSR
jgi:hypothetical protein